MRSSTASRSTPRRATAPGPRFGPEAIRSASALIRPYNPALDVSTSSTRSRSSTTAICPSRPATPSARTRRSRRRSRRSSTPGVFPVALGGDHSITLAELRALARRHGPLALVQLDSHGDTWEQYFGQQYFHGTTFKRAVEEGSLDASASVQAGMRGSLYGAEDIDVARDLGFTVLTTDELRDLGAAAYGELVRETRRRPAGVRVVRHRLPRPGVRARAPARPRSAASRRRRRSRSCARCAASSSRAATSSRCRRPTTDRDADGARRARTSSTTCCRSAIGGARRCDVSWLGDSACCVPDVRRRRGGADSRRERPLRAQRRRDVAPGVRPARRRAADPRPAARVLAAGDVLRARLDGGPLPAGGRGDSRGRTRGRAPLLRAPVARSR